jgi:hypothetical protein
MSLRVLVEEKVVYEGDAVPVPRVGELLQQDGEALPIESVTWEFRDGGLVLATLRVGDRPYTY